MLERTKEGRYIAKKLMMHLCDLIPCAKIMESHLECVVTKSHLTVNIKMQMNNLISIESFPFPNIIWTPSNVCFGITNHYIMKFCPLHFGNFQHLIPKRNCCKRQHCSFDRKLMCILMRSSHLSSLPRILSILRASNATCVRLWCLN